MDSDAKKKLEELDPLSDEALALVVQTAVDSAIFAKITSDHIRADEFRAFFEGILAESDRSFAIIAHSYIDERMKELFVAAVNPEITGGPESLFGSLGPLGTSGSRIQMAASLYWVSTRTYRDLSSIRKIRNEFSHNPFISDLSERPIAGLLASMHPTEEPITRSLSRLSSTTNPITVAQRFRARVIMTTQYMISEMAVAPMARENGVAPFSPLKQGGYLKLSPPLRALWRSAVEVSCSVLDYGEQCR
jgi:hypothetical protein